MVTLRQLQSPSCQRVYDYGQMRDLWKRNREGSLQRRHRQDLHLLRAMLTEIFPTGRRRQIRTEKTQRRRSVAGLRKKRGGVEICGRYLHMRVYKSL